MCVRSNRKLAASKASKESKSNNKTGGMPAGGGEKQLLCRGKHNKEQQPRPELGISSFEGFSSD